MGKAGKVTEALAWLEDTYNAAAAADAGDVATGSGDGAAATDRPGGGGRGGVGQAGGVAISVGLDHSSFMAVLSACSKAGKWESALSVLRDMDRAGVTPETVAFNTVLAGERKKKRRRN